MEPGNNRMHMDMSGASDRNMSSAKAALHRLEQSALAMMERRHGNEFQRNIVMDTLKAELRPGYRTAVAEVHSAKLAERVVARAIRSLVNRAAVMQDMLLEPGELHRLIDWEIYKEFGEPVLSLDDAAVKTEAAYIPDLGPSLEEIAEESEFEELIL